MNVVNLTPHVIIVRPTGGTERTTLVVYTCSFFLEKFPEKGLTAG